MGESNCSSREKTEKERDKKHASTVITGAGEQTMYSFLASSNIPRNGSLQGPFIWNNKKSV